MSIKVGYPLGEGLRVFDLICYPIEPGLVVNLFGDLFREVPQGDHCLILKNGLSFAVHHEDTIKGRIDLGLEKGGPPAELVLGLLVFGDVAYDLGNANDLSFVVYDG